MKKKLLIVLVIGVCAALVLPVSNLFIPLPASRLASIRTDDPYLARALPVLEQKCIHCHTSEMQLPWYARFPVANRLIEHDILTGTKHVDYLRDFFPEEASPVSEPTLAKTEFTTVNATMPPPHYLLLHWNHRLTADDEEALLAWIYRERERHHATPGNPPEVMRRVLQPLPDSVAVDPAKAALGEKLFHDVRLSKDNTISCASCHDLRKGGTDQLRFSVGVGGATGDINSPTVFNSGFQFRQFWDGRAATLEEQADGPVNNPIEMASSWAEVTAKLQNDPEFTEAFLAAYPDGYKKENFVHAIAEFERTLITPAPLDAFLKGDESALTERQRQGYQRFHDLQCANCHTGVILGGKSFELMGLRADYFGERGNVHKPDYGRFNVTQRETDRFRFKTPTLRNIALTFPYLHDGTAETLEEVVDIMGVYQVGQRISTEDNALLVEFLKALTGTFRGEPL